MPYFALIGGGELTKDETIIIDEYIVSLSKKKNPQFLFIPSASHDSDGYIKSINSYFGNTLGCICDSLCLSEKNIEYSEIDQRIMNADIIYVGGGDTKYLIDIWKKNKVDIVLKKAMNANTILCGLSAGSICWFEKGISDTESFSSNQKWNYSLVDALGFIPGVHCPHFDEREQEEAFHRYLRNNDIGFIGIENRCAIIIEDRNYRIIRSDKNKNAYKVKSTKGNITKKMVEDFGKVEELYSNS